MKIKIKLPKNNTNNNVIYLIKIPNKLFSSLLEKRGGIQLFTKPTFLKNKDILEISTNISIEKLNDLENTDNLKNKKDTFRKIEKIIQKNKDKIKFNFNKYIYLIDLKPERVKLVDGEKKYSLYLEDCYFIDHNIKIIDNAKSIYSLQWNSNYQTIKVDLSKLDGLDFEIPMYYGGTGTGKTYKAVTENDNFMILVPTRQLAYEIFNDYKGKISALLTGETHINDFSKNCVAIYEELNDELIDRYDTIIVDEAHFLNQGDNRAVIILEKIIKAIQKGKKVIFLTATDNFSDEAKEKLHIKKIVLKPWKKVERIKIDYNKLLDLVKEGKTVLVFTKYAPDEGTMMNYASMLGIPPEKSAYMSANVLTSDRIITQMKFKKGELQLVVSSNVLAQGVNFPADIVVIEYNEWDSWEIIDQKIGRAGRPQFTDKGYYYLQFVRGEKNKKNIKTSGAIGKLMMYRGIYIGHLDFKDFEIPTELVYLRFENKPELTEEEKKEMVLSKYGGNGGFKYSKGFLEYLESINNITEAEKIALNILKEEEKKVKRILAK